MTTLQTNQDKLCYLHAWQSTNASTIRLLRFSSNRPICINTGASCCISNVKSDFIKFQESKSSVFHGISSGLSITGTGTLKWSINNDNGDEVIIHLPNSLYVPDAPMCLLSPQHMAKYTKHELDGFHSKENFSVLTFSGHQRTIHYNSTNNLPIIFLASDFSTVQHLESSCALYSSTTMTQHNTNFHTNDPLSPSQRKLLNLHYKLGHHNMGQFNTLQEKDY